MGADVSIIGRIDAIAQAAGRTSVELARETGIDATALSKVRGGQRSLKPAEVVAIAKALHVSPLALLDPESLSARLPAAARAASHDRAVAPTSDAWQRIQALVELHDVLARQGITNRSNFTSDNGGSRKSIAAARAAAIEVGAGLDVEPGERRFERLVDAIEAKLAVDVLVERHEADALAGAAVPAPEFPFIFVNADQSRARALFTLAHELGHIIGDHSGLFADRKHLDSSSPEERFANAFAAELLIPLDVVSVALDKSRVPAEVLSGLMLELGVSFESLIYRLHTTGCIKDDGRDRLLALGHRWLLGEVDSETKARLLVQRDSRPERHVPSQLASRMHDGYERGVISARPLAGLLGVDLDEFLAANEIGEQVTVPEVGCPAKIATPDDLFGVPAA